MEATTPRPEVSHNAPVYTVSEISGAVRRVVEDGFGYVRVRGEVSGLKRHASGHVYFSLKDQEAVLASVCWRGMAEKLGFEPSDGLEVICSGRMTTFPGQSKYQLVVTGMIPAGIGGIMAMLEARKQKLAAEGLFDPARKRPLPFLPRVIGVVTSPTGAVIRDILHRLRERFPVHVLLWPVAVQGEGAADQVAAAIHGFNQIPPSFPDQEEGYHAYNPIIAPQQWQMKAGNRIMRPDLLIVARGGGSVEDLLCFSEEAVVRAAAHSRIPVISAIGHETDTSLLDFVADYRAPTPTAAAEKAVPVRSELMAALQEAGARMTRQITRRLEEHERFVAASAKAIPNPAHLLQFYEQRLDDWGERLEQAPQAIISTKSRIMRPTIFSLRPPVAKLAQAEQRLSPWQERLDRVLPQLILLKQQRYLATASRLSGKATQRELAHVEEAVHQAWARVGFAFVQRIDRMQSTLHAQARLLESYQYKRVLERGFALIRDERGLPVFAASQLDAGQKITIEMKDGTRKARVDDPAQPRAEKPQKTTSQPSLF